MKSSRVNIPICSAHFRKLALYLFKAFPHNRPMDILKKTGMDPRGKWIVLCHGYGADASDLRPLADLMHLDDSTNWLFPNGILEVPIGPQFTGRAWFPIDMEALQLAMMRGEHRIFSTICPPGLDEARTALKAEIEKLGVPWSNIVLGGFSQGAMLATDLALSLDETPRGLVILSGVLVNADQWGPLLDKHPELKVIQSHGRMDPLLDFAEALKLHQLFEDRGIKNEFLPFEGGHEIPPAVLARVREFLKDALAEPKPERA